MENIDQRLYDLALARQRFAERESSLRAQIAQLNAELAQEKAALDAIEGGLKDDLKTYMLDTGDFKLHPFVHFRRTKKLIYDRDEVLEQVKAAGRSDLVRVKEELRVREFESAWQNGELDFAQAEEVFDPVIAIDKLGHLLLAEREDTKP